MTSKYIVSLLGAIITLLISPATHAKHKLCNDKPIRWGDEFKMYRDRCSLPNADHIASHELAGQNWNRVLGYRQIDAGWWYENNCNTTLDNGRNEVARVLRNTINGKNGSATWLYGACDWVWDEPKIYEADVKVAHDLNFAAPDSSFLDYHHLLSGRAVVLHEFGHALGLGDITAWATMNSTTIPLAGGGNAVPFPYDAQEVRQVYGSAAVVRNVFASAQRWNGNVVATNTGTVVVCRTRTYYPYITLGNNGSVGVTQLPLRIYLKNSSGVRTVVWDGWATVSQYTTYTFNHLPITVPATMPLGDYRIEWSFDHSNTLLEMNETDNTVMSAQVLRVISAC